MIYHRFLLALSACLFLAVQQYHHIAAEAFSLHHQKAHRKAEYLTPFCRIDDLPLINASRKIRRSVEDPRENDRFLSSMVASAGILFLTITAMPPSSHATTYASPVSALAHSSMLLTDEDEDSFEEYIGALDLKPATESQPQIKLPKKYQGGKSLQNDRRPLLQGLVYFAEQQTLGSSYPSDYNDDLLILTAYPIDSNGNRQDTVLAGAKIPISTTRFPFLFQMYKENLTIKNARDIWFGTGEGGEQEDVVVEARICPKDSIQLPCSDREMRRFARGIGKVLSGLPGLEEGQIVRAPASLSLQ